MEIFVHVKEGSKGRNDAGAIQRQPIAVKSNPQAEASSGSCNLSANCKKVLCESCSKFNLEMTNSTNYLWKSKKGYSYSTMCAK